MWEMVHLHRHIQMFPAGQGQMGRTASTSQWQGPAAGRAWSLLELSSAPQVGGRWTHLTTPWKWCEGDVAVLVHSGADRARRQF